MLTLQGAPALSDFRINKLIDELSVPGLYALDAAFIHFVDLDRNLTEEEFETLKVLLTYGSERTPTGSDEGLLRLVVPRLGTISPWSSKATDIIHICGLSVVRRVERGIAYRLHSTQDLEDMPLDGVDRILHDRMTENVLSFKDLGLLFVQKEPKRFSRISVLQYGAKALEQANTELGLALTRREVTYLVDAFIKLKRDPTDVEIMMFAQANSEHCRHKTFRARWKLDGVQQDYSLMEMIRNTYDQVDGKGVLSAYEDNASVIEGPVAERFFPHPRTKEYKYVREPINILMKVETHNHPTAIAPFAGAATGAGGEIRDEGAVGRGSKPKAGLTGYSVSNLRIPGHSEPWEQDYGKPKQISSALDIMIQAPVGGAAFNNEFGRPNLCGYFRTFEQNFGGEVRGYHKPIMIAGGLGNIRTDHIRKREIEEGAALIVLGGPAMLIGLGGGAASSLVTGTSDVDLDYASVQRSNPEIEHRCQEVIDKCWQLGDDNPIQFIHDVGAGGLSNALPELVRDGGVGGDFQLRLIPTGESGMSPMEIWCNESQERYVLAVRRQDIDGFAAICARERCPYAVVGYANKSNHIKVDDKLFGDLPVDLPLDVLFGEVPVPSNDVVSKRKSIEVAKQTFSLEEAIHNVMGHPAVASKKFLITIADRSVGGLVSRDQMIGPWQVPVSDVAVSSSSYTSLVGEGMSMGERAPLALLDAPASGRIAIGEAITNIAAARIEDISKIKISANWMAAVGHRNEDANLYKTVAAVGLDFCPKLGICIPVGKDSTSMKTQWEENGKEQTVTAPMSLIVSAFSPVVNIADTLTPQLENDLDSVLLLIDLGSGKNRLGGSILMQCQVQMGGVVPDVDDAGKLKNFFGLMQSDSLRKKILAYHDRSDGGLLVTLAEMIFASRLGLSIVVPEETQPLEFLFNEELGCVIQVALEDQLEVSTKFSALGISVREVGKLSGSGLCIKQSGKLLFASDRATLEKRWSEPSYYLQAMRDNPECAREEFELIAKEDDPGLSVNLTFSLEDKTVRHGTHLSFKPRIAILREQGVNSHMEMAAAFLRAGFAPVDVHMSDLLERKTDLDSFQGLVACGGFSFGDVLGAGEGWAKSILFRSHMRELFASFFNRPDTFGLGVCNGCQMFSILKDLIPGASLWPKFVANRSEQFEARFSLVRVPDTSSVLFKDMSGSHMPIAVSHGEGRADCSFDEAQALLNNGQVVLQFIDNDLEITENYPMNPNGSPLGIAGVTTPDGRFTAMMPHPERVFRTVQNPWHPPEWNEDSPWMKIFRNAKAFLETSSSIK